MLVHGKTVVVTGGGNGIGREVVLELRHRGARVAAVDVRGDSLAETRRLAGDRDDVATFEVDLTDRAAVTALPDRVRDELGEPDGLVNVAGIIQPFVRLVDLDVEVIERVFAVNVWGTLHTVQAFLPGLLERPVAHVANVSSMGGYLPVPGQTAYGASKAAVKLLTEGLYAELLDTEVGVSVVFPGAVRTEITTNSDVTVPSGAGGDDEESSGFPTTDPDEAARIIVDGIEEDRLHVFVGRDARLLDVAVRVAPKRAIQFIASQMKSLLD